MPLGGGGVDDQYTARFVVDTGQAERALNRLDGILQRMTTGAARATEAAIGQALREGNRLVTQVERAASSARSPEQQKALRATAQALRQQTTELYDLHKQYKAGSAELSNYAKRLKEVAEAVPTTKGAQAIKARVRIGQQAERVASSAQELARIEQIDLEARALRQLRAEQEEQLRIERERARLRSAISRKGFRAPEQMSLEGLQHLDRITQKIYDRRRAEEEALRAKARIAQEEARIEKARADQAAQIQRQEEARAKAQAATYERTMMAAIKVQEAQARAQERAAAQQARINARMEREQARHAAQMARIKAQEAAQTKAAEERRARAQAAYYVQAVRAQARAMEAQTRAEERARVAKARAAAQLEEIEARHKARMERLSRSPGMTSEARAGRTGGIVKLHSKERGQMMPERTREQAKALLDLSSAAQGVMLGMSAAQGNIMGVAFSLVFLSYGIVKIVALFAALTAAVMTLKKALIDLPLAAAKVAREFEATGQQMASFLRSAEASMKIMAQANALAARFGMEVDDLRKGLFELTRVQQNQDAVVAAFLNAAAATGRSFGEIAAQYSEILRASADQRSRLVQQFAKDMDITVRDYANTAELIDAINKRFTGSADAYSQTTKGMLGRIRGYWTEFMTLVGSVANEIIKPLLELFMSFVQGLTRGFSDALDRGKETGELTKRITDLREAAKRLAPYLERIGYFLGRALYYALVIGMQALKKFIDTLRWAIQLIKDFVDTLRGKNNELKETLINYPPLITGIVTVIARLFVGLFRTLVDDFAKKLPSVFDDTAKALKSFADDIARPFKAIADDIAKVFAPVRRFFANLADDILKPFKPLGRVVTNYLDEVGRAFKTFFDDIARISGARNLFSGLRSSFDDLIRALGTATKTFADDVGRIFKTMWDDAGKGVARFAKTFVDDLTRLPSFAKTLADDIARALKAPFSTSFWDDLFRGIGGGGAKMGSFLDDVFKGIGGLGKGAFKGILNADDIIRGIAGGLDDAAKGVISGSKNLFGNLISALKSGLIIALVEAVALKGVDMLPISDKLKTSLSGIVQTTALGAGLGTAFGPAGILVGAALGAAIGAGLELIGPGTSKKVMDWINENIGKAVIEGFKFIKEEVLPTVRDFLEGLFGEGGDSNAANLGEGLRTAIEKTKEVISGFFDFVGPKAKATWDFVRSESAALADWIITNFGPTFADMKKWFEEEFWPSMQSVWGWIKENIVPILAGIASFIVDTLGPALLKLVAWLAEHLWPIIKEVADAVGTKLAKEFNALWELFENYVWPVIKTVVDKLGDLFEAVVKVAKKVSEELEPYFRSLWDFLDTKVKPIIEWLAGTLGLGALKLAIEAFKLIPGPFETIKTALDTVVTVIQKAIDKVKELKDKIEELNPVNIGKKIVDKVPVVGQVDDVVGGILKVGKGLIGKAEGGRVPGTGNKDTVPTMLTPGELVLNAAQQKNLDAFIYKLLGSQYSSGASTITINVQVSDSVVTNDLAMNQLAGAVADKIVGRMGLGRQFTFHRV